MKLIVGLGNPGAKYSLTRHNIGFLVIDALAKAYGVSDFRSECKSLTFKTKVGDHDCLFAKPQTFMNLSGEAVQALMSFYKISIEDLLIAHDEVDLPFGALRFQTNRGHGGNNGIRSIHQVLGDKNYDRLKIGIGRPANSKMDMAAYVLQNFNKDEWKFMEDEHLSYCVDAVECYITNGLNLAATQYNRAGR